MEPMTSNDSSPYGSLSNHTSYLSGNGPRISEIMNRDEGVQRKLPVPKVAVQDMLNPVIASSGSGTNSERGSLSGDTAMERY